MNLNALLDGMSKVHASDLHLKLGSPPTLRINSRLRPTNHPALTADDIREVQNQVMPERLKQQFEETGSADFAYVLPNVARYRVASFRQRGNISVAFRRVSVDPPALTELNLPDVINRLPKVTRGLILVTGVTGSGKSTTLAAIIQQINLTRREHIVTIEDPIEYMFVDKLSLINQMEVGLDCPTFGNAMRRILRFDPDIIMIGEMRDRETIDTALQAVDTGHMVLSTLHTSDAKQTINRILHFYNRDDQPLILEQLALNLHTIISQRLLPRADVDGLVPACEVLVNTPIVSKLITEGRIDDIQQALKNEEADMQSFDLSLTRHVKSGKIALEEALKHCSDEATLRRMLRGEVSAGDRSGLIGGGFA